MSAHKTKSKNNSKFLSIFERESGNSESEKESLRSEVINGSYSFKNIPDNMINDKSEDNSSFISSSYFLDPTKEHGPMATKDAPTMERNKNKNKEKGDVETDQLIQNTFSNETEQIIKELAKESGIRPNFLQKLLHKSEQAKNNTGNEFVFGAPPAEHTSNSTNSIDRFVKKSLNSIKHTNEREEGKLTNKMLFPKGVNNEEKSHAQSPNLNESFYEYMNNTYQYKPNSICAYEKFISEKELRDPSEFENMVSDLRITFINWLKKTQAGFLREKDRLIKEKKELEMERLKIQKELEEKRILDEEKIQEERKKLDIDIANNYKQLKKEKEENRKRFDDERLRFLQEIDKIKMILNLEKEKYNHEYKNFEVEKKKIVDANIATKTMIDINVGGVIFETSRLTLTQQKDSFLEQLLSGRHHIARDKNGRIFFDRDSEMFRMILNFLRNPLNIPVPKDLNESESLLKEADFYGIKFLPFPLAFCIGGFNGVDYLNSVELLDISQQCWRMCTPMQTKKAYFGSAVLNNFLYVFGGNNYDYKALFETEVYDRLRDVWYVGSNLNIPRRNNLGMTMNGRIFSIGGYDGSSIISNVEAYDNRMKAWVELAPLNTPRSSAMGVVHNNKIYVLGGTNGERLKTIEVYDEKMNQWEKFPHDLLEYRSAGTAFSYLNQIYVMGGVDNEHNVLNSVEQYQHFNKRWQFIPSIPEKRMNFGATVLSDSFVLTGGECGDVLNSCYFFSADNNEWQMGPPLLVPRFGHSMLVANL